MYCIGLTGSIGTGKSTVLNWLKEWGLPSIDGDVVARKVVAKGSPLLEDIRRVFGTAMIRPDGELDRVAMGALIFSDPNARKTYNEMMHPAIWQEMEKAKKEWVAKGCPCVVMDIPLLIELGWQDRVDEVWVVAVQQETQKRRIMNRNHYTEEEAMQRIQSQLSVEEKKKVAHVVIDNEGPLEKTKEQVYQAWKRVQEQMGGMV